jgi:hypothetical protein
LSDSEPLETCDTLREAIISIKEKLVKIDKEHRDDLNWYKKHMPEHDYVDTSWNDQLYLVYDKDEDEFHIFADEYDINEWLDDQWSNSLFEYGDGINDYFTTDLRIWQFHRTLCKERYEILYRDSKPFIDGWMRLQKTANMEYEPRFSIT